jgi:hypothetical protein
MRRLALAGLLVVAGCADHAQPLQPIPAPLMPVTVSVPVLVPLPPSMTVPCDEPQKRVIATDVQLLEAADSWRVTAKCDAAKLKAIQQAQPPVTP